MIKNKPHRFVGCFPVKANSHTYYFPNAHFNISLYNTFYFFSASETKYVPLYRFWDAEHEDGHRKA
jgi:hypothetical protein